MTDNNTAVNDRNTANKTELDLVQAFRMLLRHVKAVLLCAVLGAVLGAAVTSPAPAPSYCASTLFYIDYVSVSTGTAGGSAYTTESHSLNAATSFVDTFGVLLNHSQTLEQLIEREDLDCTAEQLAGMINYATVGGQMIRVNVTTGDEQTSVAVAEAIGDIMPEKLMAQVEGVEASVMEAGKLQPTSVPQASRVKNCVFGALAGLVVSCGVIFLLVLLDRHVYSAGQLSRAFPLVPVLTALPDAKHAAGGAQEEAYKLLRTYLMFPGREEEQTQVIGVTSSVAGEGKTAAAAELAHVLAQAGKKVLLLEGDMRHPDLAGALGLQSGPDFAAQLAKGEGVSAVQHRSMGFDAAVCHSTPADPSELVSSAQMARVVEQARGQYDHVLIDLPAVMEAADAVAVSRMTDGMLVLVRAGRATQDSVAETLRRLSVADGRVLGFVFNGQEPTGKKR